jgi:hypothetical protein
MSWEEIAEKDKVNPRSWTSLSGHPAGNGGNDGRSGACADGKK